MFSASRVVRLMLVFAASAPALRAQAAGGKPATALSGTVVGEKSGALADADVLVLGPERKARTSPTGAFRIDGLATGDYMVLVRRIGYAPALFSVTVAPKGDNQIRVELEASATSLPELTVTGTGRFADMARRLREGHSLVLSSDRVARFSSVRAALDLEVPVRFMSGASDQTGRGCLVYMINGGMPGAGAELNQIGETLALRPSGPTSFGYSQATLEYRRPGSALVPTTEPSRIPTSALTAVEFIPPEFVPADYPQVRPGCAVVQLWL